MLTTEQRLRGSQLTLENLSSAMNQLYRTMYGANEKKCLRESKVQLAAFGGGGGKGIICYNCGQQGHKAYQCPNRETGNGQKGKGNGKNKFTGTCHLCGKPGHKKADCWLDPKNASKRPKNWKGTSTPGTETGLMSSNRETFSRKLLSLWCRPDFPDLPTRCDM